MSKKILSIILGLASGSGFATSLRFIGPVGISEILFLVALIVLFKRLGKSIFYASNYLELVIKNYTIISMLISLLVVGFITTNSSIGQQSNLTYVPSFVMSVFLGFLFADAIRRGRIDLKIVAISFCATFFVLNIIANIFGINAYASEHRFSSFSNNPNQLLFYIATLWLFLGIYAPKLSWFSAPFLVYIGIKSGSDAFNLYLVVISFSMVIQFLFVVFRMTSGMKFAFILAIVFVASLTIWQFYIEHLTDLWTSADEGGLRMLLYKYALDVTIQAPVFGFGPGSFSGIYGPFEGLEAHNNFLDLSMQFGFVVPFLIYCIFIAGLIKSIHEKQILLPALILGFIVSGLFHFSARHFIFWLEFGVLFSYVFHSSPPDNSSIIVNNKRRPSKHVFSDSVFQ
jgi:hypothetical protein